MQRGIGFIAPSSSPTVLPAAPTPVIGVARMGLPSLSRRQGYETIPLLTRERYAADKLFDLTGYQTGYGQHHSRTNAERRRGVYFVP
jgi:hypothetical protein